MTDTPLISPAEVAQVMETGPCVVIDTRDPESYAAGHIPGAVNVHDIFTYLATSSPEGIAELKGKFEDAFGAVGLSGEETAIIYEQSMNTGFGQSCRGYFLLQYLGYPKIAVLHGGFEAWTAAEMPVSSDAVAPEPKTFPSSETGMSLMMGVEDMLAAVKDESVVKLDVRDIDEWIAESSSPYGKDFCPRKGRIPGAKMDRVVSHDETDTVRPDDQEQGGGAGGMRDGRHHAGYAGCALLFQGCARVQHLSRAQGSRGKGREDLFRFLE